MKAKVALVLLEDRVFALPIETLERIVQSPRVFQLPRVRSGFKGIFLIDDEVIPCIDLPGLLGTGNHCTFRESQYTLVCTSDLGRMGLPVTRVLQIVDVDAGTLWIASAEEAAWANCRQTFEKSGVRFPLLDPDLLLSLLS